MPDFDIMSLDVIEDAVRDRGFRQFCDAKDFVDRGLHKGWNLTWVGHDDGAYLVELPGS